MGVLSIVSVILRLLCVILSSSHSNTIILTMTVNALVLFAFSGGFRDGGV